MNNALTNPVVRQKRSARRIQRVEKARMVAYRLFLMIEKPPKGKRVGVGFKAYYQYRMRIPSYKKKGNN